MTIQDSSLFADRAYLTGSQYRTDANLAARQAVYAYQVPKVDLPRAVLDLARLAGRETVVDVGCGNGPYLAELARRGHEGPVLGLDLSPGMLAAARPRAQGASLAAADATALPLADEAADVVLAPHMLYHVPDPAAAAAEFRRVTRPGGQLLVVLNGAGHLAELRELAGALAADAWLGTCMASAEPVTLDGGAELMAAHFGSVRRYDFPGELRLPGTELVAGYVASMRAPQAADDPAGFAAAVAARMRPGADGTFRVRTQSGVLVCR